MSQEHDDYVSQTSRLFFMCLFSLQRTTMEDWQHLDLTMAQFKVLLILSVVKEIANNKLAQMLGVSHPTASHLVDKLVQAGQVERVEHEAYRRYTLLRLTEQGRAQMQRLRQGRLERLHSWLAQLDEPDIAALRQGLEALNRVAQSSLSQETGAASAQNG